MVEITRADAELILGQRDPIRYFKRCTGLDPFPWQHPVLLSKSKRILINGARRSGKSYIISFKPSHMAKYHPGSITLILGPTQTQAVEDMRFVRSFMSKDPTYPDIVRFSDQQVELENGSRVIVVPATEVAARGYPDPDLLITDEAAFIRNAIFDDNLLPMLSGNPQCVWLQISTTNGTQGDPGKWFYESWTDPEWERYEVRAPFAVNPYDPMRLIEVMPETEYQALRAKQDIQAFYSPRHANKNEQEFILRKQGSKKYARNQLCEFVEAEGQVFSGEELTYLQTSGKPNAIETGLTKSGVHALEWD